MPKRLCCAKRSTSITCSWLNPDVFEYFLNAKALICTSLWEDPGFVLIEAAMSNLTILSSNCKSGPEEIIGKNEKGGFLFENNDIISLNKMFLNYFETDNQIIYKKKIYAKKKIKKYSIFNHTRELNKILDL